MTVSDYSAPQKEFLIQNATELAGWITMPPRRKTETRALLVAHPLGTEIYTTEEVAAALRVSVRHILRAIQKGELKARRTGKQYLITGEAVQKYFEGLPEGTKTEGTVGE